METPIGSVLKTVWSSLSKPCRPLALLLMISALVFAAPVENELVGSALAQSDSTVPPPPSAAPTSPVQQQTLDGNATEGQTETDLPAAGDADTGVAMDQLLGSGLAAFQSGSGLFDLLVGSVPAIIALVFTLWMFAVCVIMRNRFWWMWVIPILAGTVLVGVPSWNMIGDVPRLVMLALGLPVPGAEWFFDPGFSLGGATTDTVIVIPFFALLYFGVWWRSIGEDPDDDLVMGDETMNIDALADDAESAYLLRREDMVAPLNANSGKKGGSGEGSYGPATDQEAVALLENILEPEDERNTAPILQLQRSDMVEADGGGDGDVLQLTQADRVDVDGSMEEASKAASSGPVRGPVRGPLGGYGRRSS